MEVYLVGGAVRDRLLGLPVRERDWVVVGATPEDMRERGFRPVGKDFPVFLHPETGEEYALARTERKTGPGYTGFEFHADPEVTLEQDLARRDLTINAMAEAADGTLIDPFNGQEDLRNGILRHVSPAFVEDPVRILRVARFAARFGKWGFRVAHGTHALMKRMVENGEVDHLVPERVWAETVKALAEDTPERYFEVLHACGALARVFPELDRLFGVPQPAHHHPEVDTGIHCLLVLRAAAALSSDPEVRFAALVHDLGKGTTPPDQWPHHRGHEARSVDLVKQMAVRLRIPNAFRDLGCLVAEHHGTAHRALELRPATLVDLLGRLDAFRRPDRFEQFLLACHADVRGRKGHEQAPYPQGDWLRAAREACATIDAAALAARGLRGAAIAEAVRERRIDAVRAARKAFEGNVRGEE
ncbi:multifunctional CCA addition/repair protein [Thiohalobacter sp.]|uniref:multifunctional CCA addition/repair protein n=1 Tax=Thiohalobacter sp. TaxID=2025948 RepID=UPI002639F7E8|nr:multifunctional CCA addition/repair protein [Thiohalobacter sp.]